MAFTMENILLISSILLLLSIVASKTSGKLGVPALLFFLAIGMLAGSDGIGNIHFDDPELAQWLGVLALTLILFSGGLETRWQSVKPVFAMGLTLSTLGVLLTAVACAVFIHLLTDFTFLESLLMGSIVSSTDAAAVFSILRSKNIGLKGNLRPLLELESGSNDPMAYFLTIGLTGILAGERDSLLSLIPFFFQQMFLGALVGYGMGKLMVFVINRISLDYEGLYSVLVMALVLFTYASTTYVQGNGFLAVYISAIVMSNSNFLHKKSIIRFYDGVAWLMQIGMFLALGLLVFPTQMLPFVVNGMEIALLLMFVARPLAILLSLSFYRLNWRELTLISWVGLRGAVPIVLATFPLIAGLSKSDTIFNIVFFIVLSSVALQGTTIPWVARRLYLFKPQKFRRKTAMELEMTEFVSSQLFEIEVMPGSAAENRQIVQINFPATALVVLINRKGKYLTPSGSTQLEKGDILLIMSSDSKDEERVAELLTL